MRIAIDISQVAYQGTGVANYTRNLVENLLKVDKKNEYLLFGYSLRKYCLLKRLATQYHSPDYDTKVRLKLVPFPSSLMEFLWNRLHVLPVEWLVGKVDIFFSSDWIQPPTLKAKKVTTIHDLTPWKFPETLPPKIVAVHKRRMKWVKKECDLIICDSQSTKKDVKKILGIEEALLKVISPGSSLQPPGLNKYKPKEPISIL